MIPTDTLAFCGLIALGVILCSVGGAFLARIICDAWDRSSKFARVVFALAVGGLMLYGGAKPGTINYPRTIADFQYFTDNGSILTNDIIRLDFGVNILVPTNADFRVDVCEVRYTNDTDIAANTSNIYLTTIGELPERPFDIALLNATNYNVWVYSTWQPAAVGTNGVAEVIGWLISTNGNAAATLDKRTIYIENIDFSSESLTNNVNPRKHGVGNPTGD